MEEVPAKIPMGRVRETREAAHDAIALNFFPVAGGFKHAGKGLIPGESAHLLNYDV